MAKKSQNERGSKTHLPDVQMEKAEVSVLAGVTNLQVMHESRGVTLPAKYTILTSTNSNRGVHMSRLVAAAKKHGSSSYVEQSMREICREVDLTQPGCKVAVELQYPFQDQFVNIRVETASDAPFQYTFERIGITACPCSKKIVGIGHMQRASLKMQLVSDEILDFEEVALRMGECFSTMPEEFLKRVDEAKKITEAQLNPKFAEDLVRECLKRFPDSLAIEARCFESIHAHDATALWRKGNAK
ncbi:MAG: GTP cyclohydrolase I FolE2 [Thaumarchaeota archaeon]|nr:GTP cyclohydrolase I FolE2 [Nitrososphaerota archaeon]